MSTVTLLRVITAVGVLAALAGTARADDDADALAGPKTTVAAPARLTIVKRDFQGRLEQLEERPEVAAVRLLTLDDPTRAKVDALLSERAAVVASLATEHYSEIFKLQSELQVQSAGGAMSRDARRARREILLQLREIAKPLLTPPLVETLASALPESQATQLRDMVKEYRDAAIASESNARGAGTQQPATDNAVDSAADAMMKDDPAAPAASRKPPAGARLREQIEGQIYDLRLAGREVNRAFQTFIADKQEQGERFLTLIDATPEQRAKIDKILREKGEAALINPTPAQRQENFQRILAELTPQQRRKLLAEYRGK